MGATGLLTKALYAIATRGPIGWAGRWNERARMSLMYDIFDVHPMCLRGVLPWGDWPRAGFVEAPDEEAAHG